MLRILDSYLASFSNLPHRLAVNGNIAIVKSPILASLIVVYEPFSLHYELITMISYYKV